VIFFIRLAKRNNNGTARVAPKSTLQFQHRAVNEACNDALFTVKRLNLLMENLLHNDVPTLQLWQSARHVGRYTSRKRAESGPDAEKPEITQSDAAAVQA